MLKTTLLVIDLKVFKMEKVRFEYKFSVFFSLRIGVCHPIFELTIASIPKLYVDIEKLKQYFILLNTVLVYGIKVDN